MQVKYDGKEYICSFEFALDMVSGKWRGLILWHLSHGTMRYGEIRKTLETITQKMLTQTLRDLEKHQLITRKVYPVVPPKVEYTITENGQKLIPIFEQLSQWGNEVGAELGEVMACEKGL
ncbi:MAG: helix-turn-helix transcriptional regulator [Epsilonproteobacteria bacterium]|nr:helix-turn-helix transcriptional regulator [Campylobacterota bacterium]